MSETPEVTDTPDENVESVEEPKHDRPSEADRRAAERHAETETQRTEAPEETPVPAEAVEPMPTDPPSEDELNSTFPEQGTSG